MGRGVSSGGGQSSLGYLFGTDEVPKSQPVTANDPLQAQPVPPSKVADTAAPSPAAPVPPVATRNINGVPLEVPAGVHGANANNYHRADGQNTGNFITDRPSTKVHSAPGGGSSLGYLFGGN